MAESDQTPSVHGEDTPLRVEPSGEHALRWNELWRRGAVGELVEDLHHHLDDSPRCLDAALRLALAHWHTGRPAEAMAAMDHAEHISADHPDVNYCRGLFLAALGHEQEALCRLARTVQVDPRHWNGHVLMGMLYSRLGHHAKAAEALNRAKALDTDDAGLRMQLAVAHACAGHGVSARDAFREAAELECEAWHRVPIEQAKADPLEPILGRVEDDKEALDVLADLPPSDSGHRLSERLEGTFREAAESHPEYPDVQYRCGRLLARLGRQADAVEHLQRAVRLNDRFVKARLALAACYEDIEKPGQAARQLELALEQGAQHPDVHYRLGRCYRALGRTREATEALGRATAINPGFVAAHKALRELSTQAPPGEPGLH